MEIYTIQGNPEAILQAMLKEASELAKLPEYAA